MIVRLDALLVDQLESDGDLLGVHCARVGDVEGLKHFLDEGGNVNATDQSGTSMLHYAASHGHQACLNLLLKHQSDPNIKNRHGDTPLHYCFHHGFHVQLEAVRSLLYTPGIKVDLANDQGHAAVHLAALIGSNEAIALLISKGCDLELKCNNGLMPHEVAQCAKNPGLMQWILQVARARRLRRSANKVKLVASLSMASSSGSCA